MKQHLTLLCLGILFCSTILDGQDVTVSSEISLRGATEYEIIGKTKDKFYLLKGVVNDYNLFVFDEYLDLKYEEELDLGKRPAKVVTSFASRESFQIFYRFREKGKLHLMVREYNDKLNMLDSSTLKIFNNFSVTPEFYFRRSKNKRYILFFAFEKAFRFSAVVYDTKLKKVHWEQKFSIEKFNHYEEFESMMIDNQGNMYMVYSKGNRRTEQTVNRFEVFKYSGTTRNYNGFNASLEGKLWYDVSFKFDNINNNIIGIGLYSNKRTTHAEGYFYMTISIDTETSKTYFHQFDKEMITQFLGKDIKEFKGISDVDIQEIVLRSDGGAIVATERNKKYVRRNGFTTGSMGDVNRTPEYADYYYNDILVLSINPNGELHWSEVLHKKQYSQNDQAIFSSFFLVKTKTNLRFLYNDSIKKDNAVNEYIVTGNGKSKRVNTFSTDGQKLKLRIRDALQVSANELIIPSEYREKLKLVRLSYN